MKKLLVFALTLCCVGAMAQEAVITFTETRHDFGKINESDGRVTHVFEFRNEGMAPLTLTNVRASCGCTTPEWTKSPVEPGGTGVINVTYNPNGRPGKFNKTITVTANTKEPTTKLYISGEVIPKSAKPAEKYKVKMGNINVSQQDLNFGDVKKGAKSGDHRTMEIQYGNNTNNPVTVGLLVNAADQDFIIPQVTLPEIQPNQEGKIVITLNSEACELWGPVATSVYVVVDGQKDENHKISIKANIKEDFSALSEDELKNAPILEMPNEINLGTVKAGATIKHNVKLKNVGSNPLQVRRVINTNPKMTANLKSSSLKSGKSANLNLVLQAVKNDGTPLEAGLHKRQLTFITNDPQNSVKKVEVVWTVE